MIRPAAVLMLVACAALSGCGTFSDAMCGPANDHVFYRGVRFDIMAAQEGGAHSLMAADIPLSAIADTLLLPWAIQYVMEHREPTPPAAGQR